MKMTTAWQNGSKPDFLEDPCILADGEVQVPLPFSPTLNRIVTAANKMPDGTVIVGVRHWDSLMHRCAEKMDDMEAGSKAREIQGFVDRMGVFHTREEAWKIAYKAGQIIRRCGNDGKRLWSENLY